MQSDKWNPADIWMVDPSVLSMDFPTEIDGKDEPDAIGYGHITAVLVKAVQELSAKVTALENA